MRAGELILEDSTERGRHTVSLWGELDLATAPDLEHAILTLRADGAREVVLDLGRLEFVDSPGLRAPIAARTVCEDHNCDFTLIHPRETVERLFRRTGLLARLPFRHRVVSRGPE